MKAEQFEAITIWQKETFGQATPLSKIAHLAEELQELVLDLQENAPDRRLEYADCFLLLFGSAAADGMSYEDICNCIEEKMVINRARKWGKPQANGVVNHIKEEPTDLPAPNTVMWWLCRIADPEIRRKAVGNCIADDFESIRAHKIETDVNEAIYSAWLWSIEDGEYWLGIAKSEIPLLPTPDFKEYLELKSKP